VHLKGNRIAAYARYSSDKQSENSIEDQLRRFRELLAREGRSLDEHLTLTDYAVSGASTSRPGFEVLLGMVRRREIDVLLVEDVSRLSRDQCDAHALYKELAYYNVQLISLADGIDSTTKGAKLAYSVKALMSDLYLEDLRDKTLRGMAGRAHAGLATGGRVLGYRTIPVPGSDGRSPAGHRIEIDPDGAELVRRIFALYIAGGSFHGIAAMLNVEGVPSPRDRTRHERKHGWSPSTIRAILKNERYAGVLVFGARRWSKVPGTNVRRPQKRDPAEIIRREAPELRIIDADTWRLAHEKLTATARLFTRAPDGSRKGKALAGAREVHALSGLLRCACEAPFILYGGAPGRRYYVCAAARRGRCNVPRAPLQEALARRRTLEELHDTLFSIGGRGAHPAAPGGPHPGVPPTPRRRAGRAPGAPQAYGGAHRQRDRRNRRWRALPIALRRTRGPGGTDAQ
jgi:site-specific DNA recombinase